MYSTYTLPLVLAADVNLLFSVKRVNKHSYSYFYSDGAFRQPGAVGFLVGPYCAVEHLEAGFLGLVALS
jgi:hypothetical protein